MANNRIQPSAFTTTLLLVVFLLLLFNFNFEVFNTKAAPGPIIGEGHVGFIPKWVDTPLTLTVTLTVPANMVVGQSINLQTVLGGNITTGTINYSIWWDCSASLYPYTVTPDVGLASTACGTLPINCTYYGDSLGHKCDNDLNPNPPAYVVPHVYTTPGAKRPMVIVERGGLAAMGVASGGVVVAAVPSVSNPTVRVLNSRYCGSGVHATVEGTYSNSTGDSGDAFEVLIDNDLVSNPNAIGALAAMNPEWESGIIAASIPNNTIFSGSTPNCNTGNLDARPQINCQMTFNTTYTAWARVQSSSGLNNWSQWIRMTSYSNNGAPLVAQINWATPVHAFPQADFTTFPAIPAINEPVTFTDTSTFYGAATPRRWEWDFDSPSGFDTTINASAVPPIVTNGNTTHAYTAIGTYSPQLTVTDDVGSCFTDLCIADPDYCVSLQAALPRWREVAPR